MSEYRDPQVGQEGVTQENSEEKSESALISEAPISLQEMKDLIETAEAEKRERLERELKELEEAISEFDTILTRVEESNRKKPKMGTVDYDKWAVERRDLVTLYYSRLGVLRANFSILARRSREAGLQDWGLKFTAVHEIAQWSLRVQLNKKLMANRDIEPQQQ